MAPESGSGPGDQESEERSPPVAEGWSPLIPGRFDFRLDPQQHLKYPREWLGQRVDEAYARLSLDEDADKELDALAPLAAEALRLYEAAAKLYNDAAGGNPDFAPADPDILAATHDAVAARMDLHTDIGKAATRLFRRRYRDIHPSIVYAYLLERAAPHLAGTMAPALLDIYVCGSDEFLPLPPLFPGGIAVIYPAAAIGPKHFQDHIFPLMREAEVLATGQRENRRPGPRGDLTLDLAVSKLRAATPRPTARQILDQLEVPYRDAPHARRLVSYHGARGDAARAALTIAEADEREEDRPDDEGVA